MKRFGILLAPVFGLALVGSGPASAAEVGCWYNDSLHPCVYYPGYPNGYPPGYNNGLGTGLGTGLGAGLGALFTAPEALAAGVTEPLVTGRSVAVSSPAAAPEPGAVAGPGDYCATPARTCRLIEPGWLGTGCSCRVPGGRVRGFVK